MENSEIVLDKIIDKLLQAMWQTEHEVPHFDKAFADYLDPKSGQIKTEPSPPKTVEFLEANTSALNNMTKILHQVVDASAQRLKFQFYESLVDKGLITWALCQFTAQFSSSNKNKNKNNNNGDGSDIINDYLSASTPLALNTPQKQHPCFDYPLGPDPSSVFFSPVPISRQRHASVSSDGSLWSPRLLETIKNENHLDSDIHSSQCDTEQTLIDEQSLLTELPPLAKTADHKSNLLFKSPLSSKTLSQAARRTASAAVSSSPQLNTIRIHSSCDNLRDTSKTLHRAQPSSLTYKRSSTLLRPESGTTPGYLAPTISSRLSSRDSINVSEELLAQERDRQRRITMTSLGMYRTSTSDNTNYLRPSSSLNHHSTKQFIFSDAGTNHSNNSLISSRTVPAGGKTLRIRPSTSILRDPDYF